MATKKTSSFVTEIPLKATPYQEKQLNKRLEASRQVYNACLGETLRRLNLMRQSRAYQRAVKMPKGGKERVAAFTDIRNKFDLVGKYSINGYAQQFNRCWITHHLGSQLIKAISSKAFLWVMEYAYGKRGRPKFKRYGEYNSVESGYIGKEFLFERSDGQWIASWAVGKLWTGQKFSGKGKVITLPAIIDESDLVIAHGLSSRLKYVRLVRKVLNGKSRFYAQLVNEGLPFEHIIPGAGIAGVDIGPSTIAGVVIENDKPKRAFLQLFCQELDDIQTEITKLQRAIARQRRINNDSNYEPDRWVRSPGGKRWIRKQGKSKKGFRSWTKSNAQKRNEIKLQEIHRRQAAYRQSLHGYLVNQIVSSASDVRLEKLSYKAFQRMFGRSVGKRAPGAFVAQLKRRVEQYNGVVNEFSTYRTRLSQICHGCGTIQKKPLSERWHTCPCGVEAQRDLYSAFLAVCVEDEKLSAAKADMLWPGAGPLLQAAMSELQTGKLEDVKSPSSFGLNRRRQSRSPES